MASPLDVYYFMQHPWTSGPLKLLAGGMRKTLQKSFRDLQTLHFGAFTSWGERKKQHSAQLGTTAKIIQQLIIIYKAAQHVLIGIKSSVNKYGKHHMQSKNFHGVVLNVARQIIFFPI